MVIDKVKLRCAKREISESGPRLGKKIIAESVADAVPAHTGKTLR
jgi:hypothetical protein